MKQTWRDLILGMAALVAASIWPSLIDLKPPFDVQTFTDIVVWLVGLALPAIAGWKLKQMNRGVWMTVSARMISTRKAEKPPWFNLLLGMVALAATFVWPNLIGLNPPFDIGQFSDIAVWLVNIALCAIFGWNMRSARKGV